MALHLAERLCSKKAQLLCALLLDQLVTGSDVGKVYPLAAHAA